MSQDHSLRYTILTPIRLTASDYQMRHAICIFSLCTGCYYWPDPVELKLNTAPIIVSADPPEGEAFVISTSTATAYVVVEDAENVTGLEYIWTISSLGEQGTSQDMTGNAVGSWLFLEADMLYDGRQLRVRVTDTSNAGTEMTWPIEVVEGIQ